MDSLLCQQTGAFVSVKEAGVTTGKGSGFLIGINKKKNASFDLAQALQKSLKFFKGQAYRFHELCDENRSSCERASSVISNIEQKS